MMYLIDEPTPFSPLAEWRRHLQALARIPDQDAPEVREAIERARQTIGEMEARRPD